MRSWDDHFLIWPLLDFDGSGKYLWEWLRQTPEVLSYQSVAECLLKSQSLKLVYLSHVCITAEPYLYYSGAIFVPQRSHICTTAEPYLYYSGATFVLQLSHICTTAEPYLYYSGAIFVLQLCLILSLSWVVWQISII